MADNIGYTPGVGATVAADDVGGVLFQRVKLDMGTDGNSVHVSTANPLPTSTFDGTGVAISSLDGGGPKALMVAQGATNFIASTANSTTVQLAASATFTGTIESIFNQQAISVLLTVDQPGTLTLRQYIDQAGTRLISSWPYNIAAGVPFSRCFTGNGNFFNLTFQNTSGVTTTTLNINTAYGTLDAVTNLGHMPVSLNEVNGSAVSLGQGLAAASLPVVLASNAGLPTGTNSIGNIGTVATVTTITNNVNVVQKGATSGGNTTSKILSAASTNATVVKASAGQVYAAQFVNTGAGWAFVKFYNKATAPTVGTDAVVDIMGIPPGGAREVNRPIGMPFAAGIAIAITGAYTDADTTAVTAGQVIGSIQYT